jgi:hypothetical protein
MSEAFDEEPEGLKKLPGCFDEKPEAIKKLV